MINLRDRADAYPGGMPSFALRVVARFLQFIFAIAVIGLYATDLHAAHKASGYTDSKWAFAVVVGTLSAVTCLVYAVPLIKSYMFFAWDAVLCVLWIAVFGTFGRMFIGENPEGMAGIKRMKDAVWIDLINMLLWFLTAVGGAVMFFFIRRGRTLHTGRAAV